MELEGKRNVQGEVLDRLSLQALSSSCLIANVFGFDALHIDCLTTSKLIWWFTCKFISVTSWEHILHS